MAFFCIQYRYKIDTEKIKTLTWQNLYFTKSITVLIWTKLNLTQRLSRIINNLIKCNVHTHCIQYHFAALHLRQKRHLIQDKIAWEKFLFLFHLSIINMIQRLYLTRQNQVSWDLEFVAWLFLYNFFIPNRDAVCDFHFCIDLTDCRKTLNPFFNQEFKFQNLPYAETFDKTLMLNIFDYDRFSKHDQIGEVRYILIYNSNKHINCMSISLYPTVLIPYSSLYLLNK